MKNDFEMITLALPIDQHYVNIYPLGDVHFGSEMFDEDAWKKWKKMVMDDKDGRVIIVGDLLDNALKTTKANNFESTCQPQAQKERLIKEFREFLAEKTIGATQGNHEYKNNVLVGTCPLYDVMCKFDLEDLYRQNLGVVKISLGYKSIDRQFSYCLAFQHGGSRNKRDKFSLAFDGIDGIITGHTHDPAVDFPAKIVVDSKNNTISQKTYAQVVVPSFLKFGGYGIKGLYVPKANNIFPVITLSGRKKNLQVSWR